jgi:hypothetical protein
MHHYAAIITTGDTQGRVRVRVCRALRQEGIALFVLYVGAVALKRVFHKVERLRVVYTGHKQTSFETPSDSRRAAFHVLDTV